MIEAVLANLREYWMVHSLLALYTVMLAHHAWTGNRSTKGLADYYVGGRNMSGWVIGLSFFATYASVDGWEPPAEPIIFLKSGTAYTGPNGPVIKPPHSTESVNADAHAHTPFSLTRASNFVCARMLRLCGRRNST